MDRYINNRILQMISSPEYPTGCSIAALTAVVNYLFFNRRTVVTQEQLAEELGVEIHAIGKSIDPGDATLREWFSKFIAARKYSGTSEIFLPGKVVQHWESEMRETIVCKIKSFVKSRHHILVYHDRGCQEGHYNVICGIFEAAQKPSEAYDADPVLRRWLVFADHHGNDPIWCRRLGKIGVQDTILLFEK